MKRNRHYSRKQGWKASPADVVEERESFNGEKVRPLAFLTQCGCQRNWIMSNGIEGTDGDITTDEIMNIWPFELS